MSNCIVHKYYVITLLLCSLIGGCTVFEADNHQYLLFEHADFLLKNQEKAPEDDSLSWQQVELPDLWDFTHPDAGGFGWYRLKIKLNVPPNRLWGIYLPRINRNVAVFLNGVLIGVDAPIENKQSNSWNHPLYFTIPNGLLTSDENLLYIRLESAVHSRGRLLPFYMGADELLRPIYEHNYFFRVTLSQLVGAFALTMGLCVGLIWVVRREPLYGWFALGSLFWAFYTAWFFVRSMPLELSHWIALTNSSGVWMIGCMWMFVGTYIGLKLKSQKRMIMIYCTVTTIVLWNMPQHMLLDALVFAYLPLFVLWGWLMLLFFRHWQAQQASFDMGVIFLSITPIVTLGFFDWVNLAFHLQYPYLLHYSAPLIFLLIGWVLIRRFNTAIRDVEVLNLELEARVAKRETELTDAFETIHVLEKQKVLKAERERIMRDIHDGVGGQLVSALAIMEGDGEANKAVSETLLFALEDLRLIIDSLAPDEEGLPSLLTMFKYRYEPKLKEHGITLKWNQSDLSALAEFSPQHSLQLLRIIQEAFTNILKHAGATRIDVDISQHSVEGDSLACITICDDGKGFPAELAKGGRGLSNMQRRARDIGVVVECFNQEKGACVRICLPASPDYS